jgi:hypothetical protein
MTATRSHPFRVFVSYTRSDRPLAERLVEVLELLNLVPLWDRDFRPGTSFTEAIKEKIASAHLFMPLITQASTQRPWVHQETGYAMGLGIPILPVAVNTLPDEMIAELQALAVKPTLEDLERQLRALDLEQIVLPPDFPLSTSEVVDRPEERTALLVRYGKRLLDEGEHGQVRQRGIFSSFSLPAADPREAIWDRVDGPHTRTPYHRQLLREERHVLERHARVAGCALLIDPFIDFTPVGPAAHRAQLEVLIAFLETMPDLNVRIALSPRAHTGHLTIVGDRFFAQAVVPRPGLEYEQTHFDAQGPRVLRRLRQFDQELEEVLGLQGLPPVQSRAAALVRLRERLLALP